LIFKLELHPQGYLDEDQLDRMGLTVLEREPGRVLVVFSSDEDLTAFRQRLSSYGGDIDGPAYAELAGIERLVPLIPDDRVGSRLRERPLEPGTTSASLDVELWHPGTRQGAARSLEQLRLAVESLNGEVTDEVIGADIVLARIKVDAARVDQLLTLDRVREVDRPPQTQIEPYEEPAARAQDLPEVSEPPDGAAGVLVVDSGITANHPLLRNLVGDAQAFPGPATTPPWGPADEEVRTGGHGTSVSGIAGLGDLSGFTPGTTIAGEVRLFSGRVLDEQCSYDPDELVEHQLEEAVRYFVDNYPETRVINLSLGDPTMVFRDGASQPRLAARIDELAYELQSSNVLFVISSGNYDYVALNAGDEIRMYPDYLLDPSARLIEPASAALALTVGGLANGRDPTAAGRRAVAGTLGHPSPFTRSGPGVGGMIKPDVVEFAGDVVLDGSDIPVVDDTVGVISTNRGFAPPGGSLLRRVRGTSFAAPAVSHLAAKLFNQFPEASPNLIRALVADSATLPPSRPSPLDGDFSDESVWRIFGYGRPDFERAVASAENDVLLIAESSIELDAYQLFEVPEIPRDFFDLAGDRLLSATLAFDPPTRHTRSDDYLGVRLQFRLFRNTTLDQLERVFRDWRRAPAGPTEISLESRLDDLPGRQKVDLRPGLTLRGRGTLQKGMLPVASRAWNYDEGTPLILAVTSQRRWAPAEVVAQRFAVVVSLKHSDPAARLHSRLRARLQPRVRVRVPGT
jgi:subtilisin family serine protease